MTSLRVCVLPDSHVQRVIRVKHHGTGSFQKSEPMQLGIPNGPFWNKSHEPNLKARDMSHMTGLLEEDLREEAKAWCLQNSLNESEFQLTLMTYRLQQNNNII